MSDSATFMNPTFLSEFIESFRQYPCLWKVKSDEFRDRNKRDEALNNLLLLTRETIPTANLKFLKDRIESLKQSFRRECRKVKSSMTSGSSADDVYKPKLWYYNIISFIADQETHNPSVSSLDVEKEQDDTEGNDSQVPVSPPLSQTFVRPDKPSFKRKRDPNEEMRKNVLAKAMTALDTKEDEFDFTGKVIASKLRKMDYNQFLHADKIINEVLYKGLQNQLSFETSLTSNFQYNFQSAQNTSPDVFSYSAPQSPFNASSTSGSNLTDVPSTMDYNYGRTFAGAFEDLNKSQ